MYCRHVNTTALFGSPVVSALGSKSDARVLVLARARCCALEMCKKKKKIPAPFLGLAKSIYYIKYGKSGVECCFYEELTQILIYLEGLMTHMGDPESHSMSVSFPNNQRELA